MGPPEHDSRVGLEAELADLHLHSTCSDGLLRPARLLEEVAAAGVGVAALTDHDTLAGLPEAGQTARRLGVVLIPGLELSCRDERGRSVHLLGYGVEPTDELLCRRLDGLGRARSERLDAILEALRGEGVSLSREAVERRCRGAAPGRVHVADALVQAGKIRSRREAFTRWLGDGRPAGRPPRGPGPREGITWIHEAGGLAVLAHPAGPGLAGRVASLARAGLDGVEVFHPSCRGRHVKILQGLAARFGLLVTGGSDCHGDAEGLAALWKARVPVELGWSLLERLGVVGGVPSRAQGPASPPSSLSPPSRPSQPGLLTLSRMIG